MIDLTIAIDKLDKIGWEKVAEELERKGFNTAQQKTIQAYLEITGTNASKLTQLGVLLNGNENATKGIEEIQYVLAYHAQSGLAKNLVADFTLARGLNY